MNRNVRILLVFVAAMPAMLVFANAIGKTHSPNVNTAGGHRNHEKATHPQHTADHDRDCALADMHTHAQRHFGTFFMHLETFGGSADWSHLWNLHWVDVEHGDRTVRLYHVIDKTNPQRRFIWTWHSGDPHPTAWQEVR